MKAVVVVEAATIAVRDIPIPIPTEGRVLVKVETAAQNPTDWKGVHGYEPVGAVVGTDFAGTVVELGPGVDRSKVKVGDRVASFIGGALGYNGGSYAEYLIAPAHMLINLPDSYSFEDAAQLGISAFTTCQMIWESQPDLPKPFEEAKSSEQPTLLVWSGATATGHYVIQYAKLAGMKVITTSSPKHFDRLKTLGADLCFDYNDPEVVKKVREVTENKLKYAADCMSEEETLELVNNCMGDEGGIISAILSGTSEGIDLKKGVTVKASIVYNLLGETLKYNYPDFPPMRPAEDVAFGTWAADLTSKMLAEGKVVPLPVKMMPKGLESVSDGIEYMMEGKVSGEKITYKISDTPGL